MHFIFFMVFCVTLFRGGDSTNTYELLPTFQFAFVNSPSQMKVFMYSIHAFLLQLLPYFTTLLLINHIFSWKSKLRHTIVDICRHAFFQDAKPVLTKHKKVFIGSLSSKQSNI